MRKALFLLFITWITPAYAESIQYTMRVDGLVCPYCAYGVEKKLKAIQGVTKVDVDLNSGLVTATGNDIKLDEAQMSELFQDAGFTFRSMTKKSSK